MKTAKLPKIVSLLILLVLSVSFAFIGMQSVGVKAAEDAATINSATYFNYSEGEREESEIKFENDVVSMPLAAGDKLAIKNKIAIDDLAFELKIPATVKELTISLTAPSFDVNGNKTTEDEKTVYKTDIENKLVIKSGAATLNGGAEVAFTAAEVTTVKFAVVDNFLTASVNGTAIVQANGAFYKLADYDKVLANVAFSAILTDGTTDAANVELISISQKTTSDKYKQTFVLNDAGSDLKEYAYPVITLNASFLNLDASGNLVVEKGYVYTLTLSQYSFANNTKSCTLKTSTNVWTGNNALHIKFNEVGNESFSLVDKVDNTIVYETFNVVVRAEDEDGNGVAPAYNMNADAREAFISAVQEKLIEKYDETTGEPIYVRLGANEYLELPSLKSMISDNVTSYENLTFTVNYNTPSTHATSSSLRIPLTSAGKYEFYITAVDKRGNELTTDTFYTLDNNEDRVYGVNKDYIFTFEIEDNAPIEITPATTQGEGYIGVKYGATGFTISATSYEVDYKLMYSANKDAAAENWVEIPDVDENIDTDYNVGGFTYEEVKSTGYDGDLEFTPQKKGYYKIICTVVSKTASKVNATSESAIISVLEKPTVVVAAENNWLANNVWSVVFLSVGSVCLIAIIVLLFVKPKEEATTTRERTRKKK